MTRPRPAEEVFIVTIEMVRAAAGAGWSARRVRRWLDRAGVLERRAGVVFTTAERLAVSFPELYRRILERDDRYLDEED